jgi:hypothetical protein
MGHQDVRCKGAPIVRVVKRGIAFSTEMQTWIYQASRIAGVSENHVIVRMLQIAREDLAAFDDAGLRRIIREPWQIVKKLPALARRIQRRSHSHLSAVTATRLTVADKTASENSPRSMARRWLESNISFSKGHSQRRPREMPPTEREEPPAAFTGELEEPPTGPENRYQPGTMEPGTTHCRQVTTR